MAFQTRYETEEIKMIKQIITIGAALALLNGCAPAKKSSLGAVVSRSPKIMTITEDQLESLEASE